MKTYPLIILGGGLAGWALAHQLSQAGFCELLLLEAQFYAAGASGVPHALLHPFPGRSLYPREAYLSAWQTSLKWLSELQQSSQNALYHSLPLWRVAYDSATAERFERSFKRAQAVPHYPLKALTKTAPLPVAQAAYGLEQGRLVCTSALLNHLRQQSSSIKQQAYAGPLSLSRQILAGETLWCLSGSEQSYYAKQIVLATGGGLSQFFADLPLVSSRGEVFSFELDLELPAAVSTAGHFIAPLGSGRFHAGATHYQGHALPPTQSWELLKSGLRWLPGLEKAKLLRVWSGLRSGLKHDREPLLGPVPDQPGLWVMAGFSTRGLLLIPTAAQLLTQVLLQRSAEGLIPDWLNSCRLPAEHWTLAESI